MSFLDMISNDDEMDLKWLGVPKGQLIFDSEGNDIENSIYFSRHPHVPNSKISLEKSDMGLNNEYKKLLSKVSAEYNLHEELKNEYINKIKLSQRAWVNFRDKNCEAFSYQIETGTQAYETSMNSCKDKMTQERIKNLVSIQNQ